MLKICVNEIWKRKMIKQEKYNMFNTKKNVKNLQKINYFSKIKNVKK